MQEGTTTKIMYREEELSPKLGRHATIATIGKACKGQ